MPDVSRAGGGGQYSAFSCLKICLICKNHFFILTNSLPTVLSVLNLAGSGVMDLEPGRWICRS